MRFPIHFVSNNPGIIMVLRSQDPIPECITHIAVVQGGRVVTRKKTCDLGEVEITYARSGCRTSSRLTLSAGAGTLVDIRSKKISTGLSVKWIVGTSKARTVNVDCYSYEIWWEAAMILHPGSDKITLLSILTSDRP
jgi:hypothetical protein